MDLSRGILYVATGARYREEAARSASSFRSTMPDVPIALCTDDPEAAGALDCFDTVVQHTGARYSYIDKARPLTASPFDRTLFLDTDTHSLSACHEVFDLLDHFDLAVAHAPLRGHFGLPPGCPAFPELNTGVIAYRTSSGFAALVDGWISRFETQAPGR